MALAPRSTFASGLGRLRTRAGKRPTSGPEPGRGAARSVGEPNVNGPQAFDACGPLTSPGSEWVERVKLLVSPARWTGPWSGRCPGRRSPTVFGWSTTASGACTWPPRGRRGGGEVAPGSSSTSDTWGRTPTMRSRSWEGRCWSARPVAPVGGPAPMSGFPSIAPGHSHAAEPSCGWARGHRVTRDALEIFTHFGDACHW